LAQEQTDLPKLRRFGGHIAYWEGWGLYAEALGKEMGFYQDPMSDFGRLGNEVWRAARLVTDTGLHSKRWSKKQAMDYFRQNTLVSELDIQKEVERYITNPARRPPTRSASLRFRTAGQGAHGSRRALRSARFPRCGARLGLAAARYAGRAGRRLHRHQAARGA
jgi:hypothetical protein